MKRYPGVSAQLAMMKKIVVQDERYGKVTWNCKKQLNGKAFLCIHCGQQMDTAVDVTTDGWNGPLCPECFRHFFDGHDIPFQDGYDNTARWFLSQIRDGLRSSVQMDIDDIVERAKAAGMRVRQTDHGVDIRF